MQNLTHKVETPVLGCFLHYYLELFKSMNEAIMIRPLKALCSGSKNSLSFISTSLKSYKKAINIYTYGFEFPFGNFSLDCLQIRA